MVSVVAFTLTAVSGRALKPELSPMHMVFYRNAISLVILLVIFHRMGISLASLKSVQPWMQWFRALVHFLGQWTWMTALLLIPLIELMAIEFTFPLLVALLAPLMLGEQLTRTRIIAAVIGFLGTLTIILAPYLQKGTGFGGPTMNVGVLFAMACAVCFAFNMIGTRYLTKRDSSLTLLMFMSVNHTVMAGVLGAPTMTIPAAWAVPWILSLAVSSLIAHFALAKALTYGDAVIVAPLDFVRVPLMVMLGVLLYHEPVQAIALAGTAFVILGNGINVWGEHRAKQERAKAAATGS